MIDEQKTQKELFIQQNQADIDRVKAELIRAATGFVQEYAGNVLPEPTKETLISLLSSEKLDNFACELRQHAVLFSGASTLYWAMVDASNFFVDAISTRWPYMTYGTRARYLVFAEQELQTF